MTTFVVQNKLNRQFNSGDGFAFDADLQNAEVFEEASEAQTRADMLNTIYNRDKLAPREKHLTPLPVAFEAVVRPTKLVLADDAYAGAFTVSDEGFLVDVPTIVAVPASVIRQKSEQEQDLLAALSDPAQLKLFAESEGKLASIKLPADWSASASGGKLPLEIAIGTIDAGSIKTFVQEYPDRFAPNETTAPAEGTITIATADIRMDKGGQPSISHTIPAKDKAA